MSDSAARERDAAETESALRAPGWSPPTRSAAYGEPPRPGDRLLRTAGRPRPACPSSSCCTAGPGGRRTTGSTCRRSRTSSRGAASPSPASSTGAAGRSRSRARPGPSRGAGPRPSTTWPPRWTRCRRSPPGSCRARSAQDRGHRALGGRAARPVGGRPARAPRGRRRGGCPLRRRCAGWSRWRRSRTSRAPWSWMSARARCTSSWAARTDFEARSAHVDPALLLPTGIATTVVQGADDITVPQAVTEAFVDAAAKAGEMVGLTLLDGGGALPADRPVGGRLRGGGRGDRPAGLVVLATDPEGSASLLTTGGAAAPTV